MSDMQKLFIGFVAVLLGTFVLILIMSWGGAMGVPPVEIGIALAIMIGAVMIHRLTEAVRERK
jgi:hypothetical protein